MDKENCDATPGRLTCNIVVEQTDAGGNLLRTTSHKNASLILGRNNAGCLVLQLDATNCVQMKMAVQNELIINRRFIEQGKGALQLPDQNVRLMLSNCAPNRLKMFIRTLGFKYSHWKAAATKTSKSSSAAGSVSESSSSSRRRLLYGSTDMKTEISPLNADDVRAGGGGVKKRPACEQVSEGGANVVNSTQTTPVHGGDRRPLKRPRNEDSVADADNGNYSQIARTLNRLTNSGLTEEQTTVLNAVTGGRNVFFTGGAGTGKSFLLKMIVRALPPDATVVTASTGVAASHIGGITLHAFAGIGSGSATLNQCVAKITSKSNLHQWKRCRCLIIDEISMVSGEFFDKLEKIARIVRKCDRPFGGIQLVLCGDFFQLPPVARDNATRSFCFQGLSWSRCVDVNFELVKVHRQSNQQFIRILKNIRVGRYTDEMNEALMATTNNVLEKDGILATHLCTHNSDADEINSARLEKLPGKVHVFEAVDSEPSLRTWFDKQCSAQSTLVLKVGTQVMLLKNLDVQRGLANGARGVVIAFDNNQKGLPMVKFVNGTTMVMKPERWILNSSEKAQFVRRQVPLKLAWALSIHKAQGMTLDCVEISLSKVFECGQAYVALSRAKSLDTLRLLDFNRGSIRAQPEVLQFYSDLRHTFS